MSHPSPAAPANPPAANPSGRAPKKGLRKGRTLNLGVVRFWWALAMLLGFFIAFMVTVPSGESGDWSKDMSSAAMRYALQKDNASGAPQQAVLNGWYTNDLLEVQTELVGDQRDQTRRISSMVFFVGLGFLGDMTLRTAEAFRAARKA